MCQWHRSPRLGTILTRKQAFCTKLSWRRAITPIIIGRFYPKSSLTYIYDYIPLYKIWIQYTNLFKRYRTETIFLKLKKGHNSYNNWWILPLIEPDLYFYDYLHVYKIWIQYTNLFKRYPKETIFQSWKRAISLIIIGGFYPTLNLTYIFMIIYMCIKNESNTLIFLKDIQGKPFFEVEKGP